MEKVLNCIWSIPICGGFCAPTENPDKSCLRHFSNEWTVPASGVYMKVGPVIEWSVFCRWLGSVGTQWGRRHRRKVMLLAFLVSFVSWFLLLFPALGLFKNESLVQAAAWAKGISHLEEGLGPVQIYIGLKARVDKVNCNLAPDQSVCTQSMLDSQTTEVPFVEKGRGVWTRMVLWERSTSCPSVAGPIVRMVPKRTVSSEQETFCEDCRASALETISFATMGAITQIMQMTTDLQRSTPFGDVNCQANMGFATSFWGTISGLMALRSFSANCWKFFPTKFTNTPVTFDWYGGTAFYCLAVGTLLKLWDAICHLLVPTPSARHRRPRKDVADLADFMMKAVTEAADDSGEEEDESEDSESSA